MTNAELGELTRDVMMRRISSREKLALLCEGVAEVAVAEKPKPPTPPPPPASKKTTRKKSSSRTG